MSTSEYNLEEWVSDYTEDLFSWAYHKVSDKELAKDLVQDTFLAAAEKLSSFKGDSAPKTWLLSILNYKIIDVYRKKVKHAQDIDNSGLTSFFDEHGNWNNDSKPENWQLEEEVLLDNEEFKQVLKECMNALPDLWNTCIKLKYLMDKKGDEICQELELAPTNYWQIIHRAKLQLRECLEKNWHQS